MIITDIEKMFSKIKNNSEYIRVSDDHPLELYIGLNEKGMKLVLPAFERKIYGFYEEYLNQ